MRGFSQVQIIGAIVALLILSGGAYMVHGWWEDHNADQRDQGATTERLLWEKREREQQELYAARMASLRAERDLALAELQGKLDTAVSNYLATKKEHANEKAKNARVERDLRAGRLMLVDPGATAAAGKACSREGPADPAAAADGDGSSPKPGGLSPELASFLWAEAGRADEVIEDLETRLVHAQDVVTAYYRLARDCHASK